MYFDSAASAQKPWFVNEVFKHVSFRLWANSGKSGYFLSSKLCGKLVEARREIARLVAVDDAYDCVFYKSVTEALNAMCCGACSVRGKLKAVLCVSDHHSSLTPWLARAPVVTLEALELDEDYVPSVRAYLRLVGYSPRFVLVLAHSSNVLSCLVPVKLYTNVCSSHRAISIVDGAQAAPHFTVSVQRLGCTVYLLASHKLYSAAGVGVCVGLRAFLNAIRPTILGGGAVDNISLDPPHYSLLSSPWRHEAGSAAPFSPICLSEVWRWRRRACGLSELKLVRYLWASVLGLRLTHTELVIVNRLYPSTRMLSFVLRTVPAAALGLLLNKLFVCVRVGAHCAVPLIRYIKSSGVCRASLGVYNSYKDIDVLVLALQYVCELSQTV
ncbi:MAG: aminotransferase class V-fold PLP-dependent enzyme [Candidatus Hodgkinia cicadicola]